MIFLFISISLLAPEFVLNKFYPKYDYIEVSKVDDMKLNPKKEVRIKVTRITEYGERYKLFVIEKDTFEEEYSIENFGMNLIKKDNNHIVDTIKWNGEAKKVELKWVTI